MIINSIFKIVKIFLEFSPLVIILLFSYPSKDLLELGISILLVDTLSLI